MRVQIVPVLNDNYAYLLIDETTGATACVDPAEAGLVLAAAAKEKVTISKILTTHHHWDHAGGNNAMLEKIPNLEVVAGEQDAEKAEGCNKTVKHGDEMKLGNITIQCLHTPGHTKGSTSFYCTTPAGEKAVFTGDTLFVGGCGRPMECPAEMLQHSLLEVLGKLPEETQVWVGHEYTLKNLEFAAAVDTQNKDLANMLALSKENRLKAKFTVPTTLRNEWMCNPFMRANDPTMRSVCPGCSPTELFARLREEKNNWKGGEMDRDTKSGPKWNEGNSTREGSGSGPDPAAAEAIRQRLLTATGKI